MKKVLFGIALILFAMLFVLIEWIPMSENAYWAALMIGFVGLVIAGIGAFTKDK